MFIGERARTAYLEAMQSVHSINHKRLILPSGKQVMLGIPTRPSDRERGKLALDPAVFPYIYQARVNVRVASKGSTQRFATFDNVTVIDGHGVRDEKGKWRFKVGLPVVDTIIEYNRYANLQGLPPVQLALVCNEDERGRSARGTKRLAQEGIIFARTGEVRELDMNTSISIDGFVSMDVETDGEFVNLERAFRSLQGAGLNALVEDNLLNHSQPF